MEKRTFYVLLVLLSALLCVQQMKFILTVNGIEQRQSDLQAHIESQIRLLDAMQKVLDQRNNAALTAGGAQ